MAQRLARKLCEHCKQRVENNRYKAHGCHHCVGTGYSGRVVISEILEITNDISSLIAKGESSKVILQEALKDGFIPMRDSAMELVDQGITSLEEVLSIIR